VDKGGKVVGDASRAMQVPQETPDRLEHLGLRAPADGGSQGEHEVVDDLSGEAAERATREALGEVLEEAAPPPLASVKRRRTQAAVMAEEGEILF
jgi:hypothetical protein